MAEKINSNFVLGYYQYLNLKGIISVRGETAFATRGRIEQNITNAHLSEVKSNELHLLALL